jgi:hypothetical protein
MSEPVEDRCDRFVEAMVDLCREHSVMLEYDEDSDEFTFMEEPDEHGFSFFIGVADLEESVRLALWHEFHGISKEEE